MLSWKSNHPCDTLSSGNILSNSCANKRLSHVIPGSKCCVQYTSTKTQVIRCLCHEARSTEHVKHTLSSHAFVNSWICKSSETAHPVDDDSNLTCLEPGHAAEFQSVGRRRDHVDCGKVSEISHKSYQTSTEQELPDPLRPRSSLRKPIHCGHLPW